MTIDIRTKRGLKRVFEESPPEVKKYFEHVPNLLDGYPLDVCMAYAFFRMELGQNMALYAGAVKKYKVNADIAWSAVGTQHMTRDKFTELYRSVFGLELPKAAFAELKIAEQTRDMVMHGKQVPDSRIRNAISCVLRYAVEMNAQLMEHHLIRPYNSLKGFSGRSRKLDKSTSRLVLKGLGFTLA